MYFYFEHATDSRYAFSIENDVDAIYAAWKPIKPKFPSEKHPL